MRHVKERGALGWYIVKSGFTAEAESLAVAQGLFISDASGSGVRSRSCTLLRLG
jgi:hypothetical protein